MGLETGTQIADLNENNPTGLDPKSQGDDHIRLVKACLRGSFENFAGTEGSPDPVTLTEAQINDAALKSEDQTVTGDWIFNQRVEFQLNAILESQSAIRGENSAGTSDYNMMRNIAGGIIEIGQDSATDMDSIRMRVPADEAISFYVGGANYADVQDATSFPGLRNEYGPSGKVTVGPIRPPVQNLTGATYTISHGDAARCLLRTAAGNQTISIPGSLNPLTFSILHRGGGILTLEKTGGGTLRAVVGGAVLTGPLQIANGSIVQVYAESSTNWTAFGNGISEAP